MSKLIIEEPPLQVLPSLALAIGLNEAIFLQQLHYLLRQPRFGKRIAEHQWIFNTVEEWQCQYFPFWSGRTIKRVLATLNRIGLIITCQPEGNVSRRNYYRIDTEVLDKISEGAKMARSMVPDWPDGTGQNGPFLSTKTSTKTSVQRKTEGTKETSQSAAVSFSAFWKPIEGTKAEQLKRLETPPDYPSESEFDAFIVDAGLEHLMDGKGGDIYDRLSDQKWHHWQGRKWDRIRDWEKYVTALNTKMEGATRW